MIDIRRYSTVSRNELIDKIDEIYMDEPEVVDSAIYDIIGVPAEDLDDSDEAEGFYHDISTQELVQILDRVSNSIDYKLVLIKRLRNATQMQIQHALELALDCLTDDEDIKYIIDEVF